jgi:DNA-directed RNA polymerase specialized sigma24 family protein
MTTMAVTMSTMALDADQLARARKYDWTPLEQMLEQKFPAVCRMSHGLTGREDVALKVVERIMRQAIERVPEWRDVETAERWFYHHTILAARETAETEKPEPDKDLLVKLCENPTPAYVAFIRAIRNLPVQQREAFILHHGEDLNTRQMATAMDCSTKAAEMHLDAAHDALEPIAGDAFVALRERLTRAYAAMTPADAVVRPTVRPYVARVIIPMRIKRTARLVLFSSLLLFTCIVAWSRRHQIPVLDSIARYFGV